MKKQIIHTAAIALLATSIIFSCKKKEETAPEETTPSTTGSGTTTVGSTTGGTTGGGNSLQDNSFTYNGRAFTTTTLTLSKDIYGTVNYILTAYSTDTMYALTFRMPSYLPTTYNGNLVTPASVFTGNDVNIGLVRQKPSPYYFDNRYYLSGGTANITNQGGNLIIDVTNAGLNNNLNLSAKIAFAIPVIPNANASYTVPAGIADNTMSVGTTTVAGNQITIGSIGTNGNIKSKAQFSQTSGGNKSVEFQFAQNFPPSGNYVAVSSSTNINPGEVYIRYSNMSPVEIFNSVANTGTITVVTDQNDVSITAKNVSMTDGTNTVSINGNFKH